MACGIAGAALGDTGRGGGAAIVADARAEALVSLVAGVAETDFSTAAALSTACPFPSLLVCPLAALAADAWARNLAASNSASAARALASATSA